MLKISKMSDYALMVMVTLSNRPNGASAAAMAEDLDLTNATVSRVLHDLAKAKLVKGKRGRGGGYVLGRELNGIKVSEVIAAVDGPVKIADCATGPCRNEGSCPISGCWSTVNQAIRDTLEGIYIMDLVEQQRQAA